MKYTISKLIDYFDSFTVLELTNIINKLSSKFYTPHYIKTEIEKHVLGGVLFFDDNLYKYKHTQKIENPIFKSFDEFILNFYLEKYIKLNISLKDLILKNKSPKINLSFDILEEKKNSLNFFEKVINLILANEISLTFVKKRCDFTLFEEIISDKKIKKLIKSNYDNDIINNDLKERLIEYEIICKEAWDDGIITKIEEINLTKKIKELNINQIQGNEIFEKVKGEYFAKQDELKNPHDFLNIKINNTNFFIKILKLPFHPLCVHEFDKETGNDIIKINSSHNSYSEKSKESIISFASALFYTKLTMSDPNVSRFVDRVINNLDFVENES